MPVDQPGFELGPFMLVFENDFFWSLAESLKVKGLGLLFVLNGGINTKH